MICFILFSVKYSTNTPKEIFLNTNLFELVINGLADSYLKQNMLGFLNLKSKTYLNSTIYRLYLNIYRANLTNNLLEPEIFEKIEEIIIKGSLYGIESKLFKGFTNLKYIRLELENIRYLFNIGIEWIRSLNSDIYVNLKNKSSYLQYLNRSIYISIHDKNDYLFPNEDFCWYINFPFNNLIMFSFDSLSKHNKIIKWKIYITTKIFIWK
jgi:hypothetical protein